MAGKETRAENRRESPKAVWDLDFSCSAGRTFMVRPLASTIKARRSEAHSSEVHATGNAEPRPAAPLVEWESGESAQRLSRSSHETDFFPLGNHFISQDNSIFCGPVSSAIVLNALRLGKREGLPQ